jgi:hypothetical protein
LFTKAFLPHNPAFYKCCGKSLSFQPSGLGSC